MSEILLKGSQRKVDEEQAKAIPAEILQGWEELTKKGKALINQREQIEPIVTGKQIRTRQKRSGY